MPKTLKVTRYTRAGRLGRNIFCPTCGRMKTVCSFAWSDLVCSGCMRTIGKAAWLLDPMVPTTYLSTSKGAWRVFHHEMPLCADKPSREACMAACAHWGLAPTHLWDGDSATLSLITD